MFHAVLLYHLLKDVDYISRSSHSEMPYRSRLMAFALKGAALFSYFILIALV